VCPLFIVVHQPLIEILLQAFQICIQLLSKGDLVELLQDCLMEMFADAVDL
jgi:hypothetical protein